MARPGEVPATVVVNALDDMLAIGCEVGDVLLALGKSYETVRRAVARQARLDLLVVLSGWKKADADRLARAQGRVWS